MVVGTSGRFPVAPRRFLVARGLGNFISPETSRQHVFRVLGVFCIRSVGEGIVNASFFFLFSTEQAEVVSEEVKDVEASPVKEKVAETKTEEAKPAAEEKADSAEETKEEAEKTAEEAPKANGEAAAAVADDSNKESDSAPTEKAEKHKLEDEVSGTPEKKAKVEESKEEEAAKEAAPTEEAAA